MRLIYTDEAGTSDKDPVCIVSAVIIEADKQWDNINEAIQGAISRNVPEEIKNNFVFHAKEVFSGGKNINRKTWAIEDRLDFIKEILCIPFSYDAPIAFSYEFKKDCHPLINLENINNTEKGKKITKNRFSHIISFLNCMDMSDFFIRKYLNNEEKAVVVAEDCPDMREILTKIGLIFREKDNQITLEPEFLEPEIWQKKLNIEPDPKTYEIVNIIDVPHFIEKNESPMLQLSDACAFAFRRCLSKQTYGDDLVLAMLGPIQGPKFINEPAWFSVAGSGLFNTDSYLKNRK